MRQETRQLITSKVHRYLPGEETHALDPSGCWVHVRDVKSIVDCENQLLFKTLEKVRAEVEYYRANEHHLKGKPIALTAI